MYFFLKHNEQKSSFERGSGFFKACTQSWCLCFSSLKLLLRLENNIYKHFAQVWAWKFFWGLSFSSPSTVIWRHMKRLFPAPNVNNLLIGQVSWRGVWKLTPERTHIHARVWLGFLKDKLKMHKRSHYGVEPLSCSFCDQSLSLSSNLNFLARNPHRQEILLMWPLKKDFNTGRTPG